MHFNIIFVLLNANAFAQRSVKLEASCLIGIFHPANGKLNVKFNLESSTKDVSVVLRDVVG